MALQKQNVSISFYEGADTKTDPNQVMPGKLLAANNVTFTEGMAFNKTNGYANIGSVTGGGSGIATFKEELVAFNGSSLYSCVPSVSQTNKGAIPQVDLSVSSVFRASTKQTQQDSAYLDGLYLYTWVDGTNGAQYMITSAATGLQIVTATTLVATAIYPRAWSIGTNLVVTYVDTSNYHLMYILISKANPSSPAVAATAVSDVNNTNAYYDGIVANNFIYFAYNASDGGGAIRMKKYNAQFTTSTVPGTPITGQAASVAIDVFADVGITAPNIWVAYYNATAVKYFVVDAATLTTLLAPTVAVTVANILNVSGWANNHAGYLFYQKSNTYAVQVGGLPAVANPSTVRTDFISKVSVNDSGTAGTAAVFLRGVGMISKVFVYKSTHYMVIAYGSNANSFEPTYFVVDESGNIVAKLAFTNGGGYNTAPQLTTVNAISSTVFQFAYLFKDLLEAVATAPLNVYTQTGVNSASIDFNSEFKNAELGQNLNIGGGFLWAYDGYGPAEQNFHLFPEDVNVAKQDGTGGNLAAVAYSYIAVYEWTDNQGNIHRSSPSVGVSITPTVNKTVDVWVPTARLTAKATSISIVIYRTAPSVTTGVYYRITSITSPILNNKTVDSVTYNDGAADSAIVGNEILYTTGGVIEDTGAPSPAAMTIFKNRLFLINAEDRNTLWYSKQTLEATPVEMSDAFTLFIDPRFGVMTELAVLDDKLILFKENALFYMVGEGPDATGANNDFSEAVFITANVGCTNFNSIVLMPDGLMFQSNKGIWLLNRNLAVSYIGAPMEAYNSQTVTSAVLVPDTTQVRFTMSGDVALVYDYYFKQWEVTQNISVVSSIIFDDLHTMIKSNGTLLQETPGSYGNNGLAVLMSLQTSWLSFAGFQGFERVYRLFIKGQYVSPHLLRVSIAYDYNPVFVDTAIIDPSDCAGGTYGDDPYYGASQYYGVAQTENEQWRVNLSRQKCQAIMVKIEELTDTRNPTLGAGLILEAMGVVVGMKSTYPRLAPTRIVGAS